MEAGQKPVFLLGVNNDWLRPGRGEARFNHRQGKWRRAVMERVYGQEQGLDLPSKLMGMACVVDSRSFCSSHEYIDFDVHVAIFFVLPPRV